MQLVISCCRLFQALFNDQAATAHGCASKDAQQEHPVKPRQWSEMDPAEFEKFIAPGMAFAFAWSIGGSGDAKSRKLFEREVENWFSGVSMPRGGGPYDGYINFHESPKMKPWGDLVPSFTFQEGLSYFQLLVPNPDTVRFAFIVDKMMSIQASTFLTGVSGVGKSVIIGNLLQLMQEHAAVVPVLITFSAQSKPLQTQLTIESKLEKKKKTLLGAPVNKSVVILIDDINMPMVEEYGSQPPIELLRQLQDQRGFWDRKKHEWKDVRDITLLLCAAPPGGGRNSMTARFSRHSMCCACLQPVKRP
jgi:dynein heavy chain